ncbi:hypothetical protein [Sandaracinus amylolyticus]|uniref:hypothetical protein n=1 Tax=Sandaracinus amylolyticus TaxID=927083 RepID=UPI001F23AEE8|nr:hypothetical protein [Sandaracinus amylolyticus]
MFSARRSTGLFASLLAPPVKVSGTRIFARCDGEVQTLAYSMHLRTKQELAMVLPLPVVPGAPEDAIAFVDLSGAPVIFDQLAMLFMPFEPQAKGRPIARFAAPMPTLKVHSVGAFDASFVPSIRDFVRLDARFRMPDEVWRALPRYHDWGFAVFTLKKGDQRVHPMAFRFPTREPARVFFPTVHVHDGEVHEQAEFDHELYWQGERGAGDERAYVQPSAQMEESSRGVVRAGEVRRRVMRGMFANDDVWIA